MHLEDMHSLENRRYLFMIGGLLHRQDHLDPATTIGSAEVTKIGGILLDWSDHLSDQFWEQQGGDPDTILKAPTVVLNFYVEEDRLMATMALLDRTNPASAIAVDVNTWWVPVDVLAGTGTKTRPGTSTLGEIVDFLGSESWEQILTDKLKVACMIIDACERRAREAAHCS